MLHRHLSLRYLLMLLALLTAGCATLTPPEISLIGVQPIGSQGLEPRLRLEFRVLNPGRKPLTVQGVDVVFIYEGMKPGRKLLFSLCEVDKLILLPAEVHDKVLAHKTKCV